MNKDSVPPPKGEYVLQLPFWEMRETAYILTNSWPDDLVYYGIPFREAHVMENRPLLCPRKTFNMKSMSKSFQKLFICLKEAVENASLHSLQLPLFADEKIYGTRMGYLLRPGDVLSWALTEGFQLPKNLSEYVGLFQINCKKPSQSLHDHVKIRVIGQYVLSENPKFNIEEINSHREWIRKFGPHGISPRTVRRALDGLFDSVGEPGRQPDISVRDCARAYTAKSLPEVMRVDSSGKVSYCFPLLKTAVLTGFEILKERERKLFLESTPLEFLDLFLKDQVMRMYLEGCQTCVVNLIVKFCTENLTQHFHHKMFSLTPEQYRESKLKHLLEMNKEFILEPVTREERVLIKTSIKPSTT